MYLLKRSLLSRVPPTRITTCRGIRQFSGTVPLLKFRRIIRSFPQYSDVGGELPEQIVQRVSYFIGEKVPHAALGFFNKKMSQMYTEHPMRPVIFDTILDLFLREKHFPEAEKVIARMENEGYFSSPMSYMKTLTLQYANDMITEESFLDSLRKVFAGSVFERDVFEGHHTQQFHKLLQYIERSNISVDLSEKIANVFIDSQGPDFWLDSLSITHIIMRYLNSGNKVDAERWLDYHSRKLHEDESGFDRHTAVPYTAFIYSLFDSGLAPVEEPVITYRPILDRMAHDGAWPNATLINALISVELRFGRPEAVLRLYDIIRENSNNIIPTYPDEATFTQLFSAAGRVVQYATARGEEPALSLEPRMLFREMFELQMLINTGMVAVDRPHVLSQNSLGAALWQFVESGDYAAACVALRLYAHRSVPFGWPAVQNTVTNALFARCKRDIIQGGGGNGMSWVDMFLDLHDVDKEQLRNEASHRTLRRILEITKRDVFAGIKHQRFGEETSDAPFSPDRPKLPKIRVRRLQLLDKLLVRALTASLATESENASSYPAVMMVYRNQEALRKAEEDMVPTSDQIINGIFAPREFPFDDETILDPENSPNPETTPAFKEEVEKIFQGPYTPPEPVHEEYDFAFFDPHRPTTTREHSIDRLLLNGY